MWYYTVVGGSRCPIVDTFWQTETGGHMITPLPGAIDLVPGSCTLPLPGIIAAIVDETGHDVPNGQGGLLVVKRPWPAMIRTIWGDPERYKKSYYPEELGGKISLAGGVKVEVATFQRVGKVEMLVEKALRRVSVGIDYDGRLLDGGGRKFCLWSHGVCRPRGRWDSCWRGLGRHGNCPERAREQHGGGGCKQGG